MVAKRRCHTVTSHNYCYEEINFFSAEQYKYKISDDYILRSTRSVAITAMARFAIAALFLIACAHAQPGPGPAPGPSPPADIVAQTTNGEIKGNAYETYAEFLGVPYAAPPTGSNRWLPTKPVADWAPQVLNAQSIGHTCPQDAPWYTLNPKMSEDW